MSDEKASATVRTGLFIGGEERFTPQVLTIADPGKPGATVGVAAAASTADVADAVAAAKSAFPAWAAMSAQERAALMAEAIADVADERDHDAAVLSQENGKIRRESWIDALVFELRWKLALMQPTRWTEARSLTPHPGSPSRRTSTTSPSAW